MNDLSVVTLQKMLDAASLRHRVIANNVANANTPGYQRREVSFSEQLAKAASTGDLAALRTARPTVVRSDAPALRSDGNNVSLERELADLMKNTLLYNTCTHLLSLRLASYKAAISGDSRSG